MAEPELIPLLGMTLDRLHHIVSEAGLPRFAASQMAAWLYKRRVSDIDEMTDISKRGRDFLKSRYEIGLKKPETELVSADGTRKYLFEVGQNKKIESVFIPDHDRATLCVSSQAGCRMNCGFCMTGRQGYHGNLTANEIINQIVSVPGSVDLTNIVFMGMGEPLDNVEAVLDVIEIMTSKWGMEWSPRRITVSTIGKLDNLRVLVEKTRVHVAISVHSPFSEERASLMPVERAYPINNVIGYLSGFDFSKQRRCSIEYIIWKGINDDLRHADALARLLKSIPGVRVNLIRYHSIEGDRTLEPASVERMEEFRDRLNAKGIIATIRASRGEDIMAACGMLAGKVK